VSKWIELFTKEKLNNKQRKIMLTVWRRKTVMERVQKGRNTHLSRAVCPCCHLLPNPWSSQTVVRTSVCQDWLTRLEWSFAVGGVAPTHSGSIRWIYSDLKKSLPPSSPISQSCLPSYLPAYIQILSSSSSSSFLFLPWFSVCPTDTAPSFIITNVPPYPTKHNCCIPHQML